MHHVGDHIAELKEEDLRSLGGLLCEDELRRRGLIPSLTDQNPCAHWRNPMDMMRHG